MANGGVNGPGYNTGNAYFQQLKQQMNPTEIQKVDAQDPKLEQEIQSGKYTPEQINGILMQLGLQSGKNLEKLPPKAQEAVTLFGKGQDISSEDLEAFLSSVFGAPA